MKNITNNLPTSEQIKSTFSTISHWIKRLFFLFLFLISVAEPNGAIASAYILLLVICLIAIPFTKATTTVKDGVENGKLKRNEEHKGLFWMTFIGQMFSSIGYLFAITFLMPISWKFSKFVGILFSTKVDEKKPEEEIVGTNPDGEDTEFLKSQIESIKEQRTTYLLGIENVFVRTVALSINKAIISNAFDFAGIKYNKKDTELANNKKALDSAVIVTKNVELIDGERHFRIEIKNDDLLDLTGFSSWIRVPYDAEKGGFAKFIYEPKTTKWWFEYMKEALVEEVKEERLPGLNEMELTTNDVLNNNGILDTSNGKLTLTIGKDSNKNPIKIDFVKHPHLLVAGITGSGKSSIINLMITSLTNALSPDELGLRLIDPKAQEYRVFSKLPHLESEVITTIESTYEEYQKVLKTIKNHFDEMQRRSKLMSSDDDIFETSSNIADYNKKNPNNKLKYQFLFIDEFADVTLSLWGSKDKNIRGIGDEVMTLLQRIAAKGRSLGIYVVLITQKPSSQIIPALLQSNLTNAICFSTDDFRQTSDVLGTVKVPTLPHVKGYMNKEGQKGFYQPGQAILKNPLGMYEVQTFFINPDSTKVDLVKAAMNKYGIGEPKKIEVESDEEEQVTEQDVIGLAKQDLEEYTASQLKKEVSGLVDIPVITKNLAFKDEIFAAIRIGIDEGKISKSILLNNTNNISSNDAQLILVELDELGITSKETGNSPRHFLISDLETIQEIIKKNLQLL